MKLAVFGVQVAAVLIDFQPQIARIFNNKRIPGILAILGGRFFYCREGLPVDSSRAFTHDTSTYGTGCSEFTGTTKLTVGNETQRKSQSECICFVMFFYLS